MKMTMIGKNAERKAKADMKYDSKMAAQDQRHINMAYVHLHEALNELQMVFAKDNVIAHTVRTLGAIEDTMFEYLPQMRRASK